MPAESFEKRWILAQALETRPAVERFESDHGMDRVVRKLRSSLCERSCEIRGSHDDPVRVRMSWRNQPLRCSRYLRFSREFESPTHSVTWVPGLGQDRGLDSLCLALTVESIRLRIMLRGYVAPTDFHWYSFLRTKRDLEEVNFWQPSGSRQFRAIERGEPFFFKLKSPQNRIAGFGVFLRSEILPDWLAWECFAQQNGTATELEFRSSLDAYRRKNGVMGVGTEKVTCLIISSPVFFTPDDWVEEPRDWKKNIVSGKGYDLSDGEGRRIFEECQARARGMLSAGGIIDVEERVGKVLERYSEGVLVRPRLGQGSFRLAVEDAYGKACAVTHEHSRPVLEAAHIKPYGQGGEHAVTNGILLRRDLHRLFDCGYVAIAKDHTLLVSERLKREYNNGRTYYALHGQALSRPDRVEDRPDATLLEWHRDVVFKA